MPVPLYQARAECFRLLGHPVRIRVLERRWTPVGPGRRTELVRSDAWSAHRSVHKSGSGSRMGVGEGERPYMIAVQEGGGTRAS